MATIIDSDACMAAAHGTEEGLLPVNPFTALQFHFGMLLGVDDLDTGQAYPRGKIRLHNAWLHRAGVVWGFKVAFNERHELTVDPGLGLDGAGHELHLERQACVDLGAWYAAHKDDPGLNADEANANVPGSMIFAVHVVARFTACLTRPVPAMAEPCSGAQTDTAFSRVFETVELLLRPGLAPKPELGYHRLRQLFQLEPDTFTDMATRRTAIQALPPDQQPAAWLGALRELAALDVIDLKPQAATDTAPASLFPEDPGELVLADLAGVVVRPAGSGWAIAEPLPLPDLKARRSHIATATIQELLCGPLFGTGAAPAPPEPTGPAVRKAELKEKIIVLEPSRALARPSLTPAAFEVSGYSEADGWTSLATEVTAQDDGTVHIELDSIPGGKLVRLLARGTGPAPLLAADDLSPLGAPGAGGADDGVDFVKTFKGS